MQWFSFLVFFTTAECLTWTSLILGSSRHDGLEASAGYLHLTAPGQFEEPLPTQVQDLRDELPLKAEAIEIAPGLDVLQPQFGNATQTEPKGLDDELPIPKNSTTHIESKMPEAIEKPAVPEPEDPRVAKVKSERSLEGILIASLRHTVTDEAEECVTTCRYGETRLEWQACLDWCVENPLMRSTLSAMLPKHNHKAHGPHVEVPEILSQRQQHIKQRSSEL